MDTFAADARYLAQTYRRFPLEIVGGQGSLLIGGDGREYIDLGGGIAVNVFGVNDAPWKAAVMRQLDAFAHCSNLYYSAPAAHLAELLSEKTGCTRVFFANSGAEANECAIKVARKWAAQCKGAEHYTILTLENSFHGRTLATLAATGQECYHRDYRPLPTGFVSVPVGDIRALEQAMKEHKPAAIVLECVQGEGGVRPIGREYAQSVQFLAEKYGILLICDEVQLGNGRSGRLYGYMNYDLHPDIVTTAKALGGGLPIGAAMLFSRVADVLRPGDHGSTFGGNPVVCAGGISILERLDETLLAGVRERSELICSMLDGAEGIESVDGMGLMLGVKLKNHAARDFAEILLKNGVLVTTAKDYIRLLPALNIPLEQLTTALHRFRDCAAK